MKVLKILLLLNVLSTGVFCQVVAIQNNENDTVYVGVPNRITVAVEGCKSNSVVLSTNNGEIRSNSYERPGHYYFWVQTPGVAMIYVKKKLKSGQLKLIDSVFFRAKRLPPPKVYLGGKKGGDISQSELLLQIGPCAPFSGFGIYGNYIITKFTIAVYRRKREIFVKTMANSKGTRIDSIIHDFFYEL